MHQTDARREGEIRSEHVHLLPHPGKGHEHLAYGKWKSVRHGFGCTHSKRLYEQLADGFAPAPGKGLTLSLCP